MTMAYESTQHQHAGLATSLTEASFDIGTALAAVAVSSIVTVNIPASQSQSAWQGLFFVAFPFALLAMLIRAAVPEPEPSRTFRQDQQTLAIPFIQVLRAPMTLFYSVMMLLLDASMRVMVTFWWAGYSIVNPLRVPLHALLTSIPVAWITMIVTIVLTGALSDVIGRRKLQSFSQILTGVSILPLFYLLRYTQYPFRMWPLRAFHFIFFGLLCGVQQGCFPALLADIREAPSRCTGLCLAYSLSRLLAATVLYLIVIRGVKEEHASSNDDDLTRYSMVDTAAYLVVASFVSAISTLLVPVSIDEGRKDHTITPVLPSWYFRGGHLQCDV